jgi:hypothetical protein
MLRDLRNNKNWDKIKSNYIGYYASLQPSANSNLVLFADSYTSSMGDNDNVVEQAPLPRFMCVPCYIISGPDESYYFTNTYYYYNVEFDDIYVQQGLVANKVMEIIDSHIFDYEITESEYRCFLEKRRLG